MKRCFLILLLAASVTAWAQGRGTGHPGGSGMGSGSSPGMGRGSAPGMPSDNGSANHPMMQQQPLKPAQIDSGAFRMLEKKTGMTSPQLQAMYQSSGAKNFGQFASAVVVSKNLGLDTNRVLNGLKTASLGQTLQNLGVDKNKAKEEIKKANQEMKDAGKQS